VPIIEQTGNTDPMFIIDPELGPAMLLRTGIRLEVNTSGSLGGLTVVALIFALLQVKRLVLGPSERASLVVGVTVSLLAAGSCALECG
jgi:hypothetical protein